jgi:Family of unknown function (DUF6481)
MSGFKNGDDFNERLSAAAKARQASLEKFRARPRADDPAVGERQAARLATSQARDARKAARAAETARVEEEAIRQAAEDVVRKAAAAQPIEVVSIFIAAGDRRDTRHHHFEHRMSDAVCIAAIRHRVCKPPHTPSVRSFSRSSSNPPLEDWLPPLKSTVSFLRQTDGRSKGSGVSSSMAAVAVGRCTSQFVENTDLLRESRSSRYSRRKILTLGEFSRLEAERKAARDARYATRKARKR